MIPILTQNIKLIILHQSSNDFTRAQQIGQLFNQYFQDKPNLIIGLQENFWQKGYQAIKQQLMPIIWGSEILNSGYNRCITENGGVSFLFNRTIYRIKNFSLLGINELPGLVYTQEDNAGMKHFKYLYSEGEEYFATKGILLAKMLDNKNNQEFFILNTHAQSTRPGHQDRIQTTLSQSASVGELICLLKKSK